MRGGLWSSFAVPGAGICSNLEPYSEAGQRPVGLIGVLGVARTPPQKSPPWYCWSGLKLETSTIVSVPFGPFAATSSRARRRSSHQAAIVSPVEGQPGAAFSRLVLQVSRLVEHLIVVDAEHAVSTQSSRRHANAADLWLEKACGDVREDHKRG